jgi:formylglycine-generating enzyme required for sulfatase activity
VKIQEDFSQVPEDTIQKLDEYIRRCDAVIHILGEASGATADSQAVDSYLKKERSFLQTMSGIGNFKSLKISYTQWEAFLAAYHQKPIFVYRASLPIRDGHPTIACGFEKDWPVFKPTPSDPKKIRAHCKRLKSLPTRRFTNAFQSFADLNGQFIGDLHKILSKVDDSAPSVKAADERGDSLPKRSTEFKSKRLKPAKIQATIGKYRSLMEFLWTQKWQSPGDAGTAKIPFIDSQSIRILEASGNPKIHLTMDSFRRQRQSNEKGSQDELNDPWREITRAKIYEQVCSSGSPAGAKEVRICITTDAGIGKTTNMQWLNYTINAHSSNYVAFYITAGEIDCSKESLLENVILPVFEKHQGTGNKTQMETELLPVLQHLKDSGQLVLLIDGLDQIHPESHSIKTLKAILEDDTWRKCSLVLSGRPFALQRYWLQLFESSLPKWQFLQLDEFATVEQRRFLGETASGQSIYDLIPEAARDILSVPRVLEYIKKLDSTEFPKIKRPSDVYSRAVLHMIKEGLSNSAKARGISLADGEQPLLEVEARQISGTLKLLAGIAFEMTISTIGAPIGRHPQNTEQEAKPNFDQIRKGNFSSFKEKVARRMAPDSYRSVMRDLDCLASMNDILLQAFFDTDVLGLNQIIWRSRTLQEFFVAYWMANHCEERDLSFLSKWVFLRENDSSEEFYWIWRFVTEMPEDYTTSEAWLRSIEVLYAPDSGAVVQKRRSNEMIYRSWQELFSLSASGHEHAAMIINRFLSEFSSLISGVCGVDQQRSALEIQESMILVPEQTFTMGATEEKQGMPSDVRKRWEMEFEKAGEVTEKVEDYLKDWGFGPGRVGRVWRESEFQFWTSVFGGKSVQIIEDRDYVRDETPDERIQHLDCYQLSRYPTLNSWFRLYAPNHGRDASFFREECEQFSPSDHNPAIHITWYDAWAFCKWAHWDGMSCRLPYENEWECAAKAGTDWELNYWWGDQFNQNYCNADKILGTTSLPTPSHANQWGFVDILGNVWEWCEECYRKKYQRGGRPDSRNPVVRGGAYGSFPWAVRSAVRNDGMQPESSNQYIGFRFARDGKPRLCPS